MNEIAQQGQVILLVLFVLLLLLSFVTSYLRYIHLELGFPMKERVKIGVRTALTIVLMYFVYQAIPWLITLYTVLLVLGLLIAIVSLPIAVKAGRIMTALFVVMVAVYAYAIYFFHYSEAFKAFAAYQQQAAS